jgi:acyl carrier protein
MTRESLVEVLVNDFELDPADLEAGDGLFSRGMLDSFSMIELVQHIEANTGVKFRATDFNLQNLDSIDRILAFVESRRRG